jgi:hypothetical protein
MLTWLLDLIAGGLTRLYGRPLGHDVAIVFLLALVLSVVVASRWNRPGAPGITAAVGVPLMSPAGMARLLADATAMARGAAGARATALAIAALVVAWLVNLVPLALGASLAVQGELARGVIYTLLAYLWIWMFLGLLPVWLLVGWYEHGVWASLAGNGLMFLVLSTPEWLMARAHRAAPAAGDLPARPAAKEGAP